MSNILSNTTSLQEVLEALQTKAVPSGGGDTSIEDGLITRTMSTYTNDRVVSLGDGAFCLYSKLTEVSFPACTSIGYKAFEDCILLTAVDFPVCTMISTSAFTECISLTSVSFPACTSIGNYAFYYCQSLTSVSFPACTSIGSSAFAYCSNLISVWLGLDSLNNRISISGDAFAHCEKLRSLTLDCPYVANLSNINAFQLTPMSTSAVTGFFGSIFVPSSLVGAYKSATNWATYADRIVAIGTEDSGDGGGGSVTLITFSISGAAYQAEEGMTWAQWVGSDYNTVGAYVDTYGEIQSNMGLLLKRSDSVYSQDVIVANATDYRWD